MGVARAGAGTRQLCRLDAGCGGGEVERETWVFCKGFWKNVSSNAAYKPGVALGKCCCTGSRVPGTGSEDASAKRKGMRLEAGPKGSVISMLGNLPSGCWVLPLMVSEHSSTF